MPPSALEGGRKPPGFRKGSAQPTLPEAVRSAGDENQNDSNVTHDGLSGLDLEYNAIGLTKKIARSGSTLAEYSYLADGARLSAVGSDGTGVRYLGSLIYSRASDGARLHDLRTGRRLAPDPLAEKYHGISQFAYCAGDPVSRIDPDGRKITTKAAVVNKDGSSTLMEYTLTNTSNGWRFLDLNGNAYSGNDSLINELTEAIGIISSSKSSKEMFETIAADENRTVEVYAGNETKFKTYEGNSSNGGISWNYIVPEAVLTISGGTSSNKVSNLMHEFAHAYYTWHINSKQEELFRFNGKIVYASELYTTHIENIFRSEHNLGIRYSYDYPSSSEKPPLLPLADGKGRSLYYDIQGKFHPNGLIKKKNRYVY